MSTVSSIAGSQQQYVQISQNQNNAAQANQSGSAAIGTKQAAAATNQAAATSSATNTQPPPSQNAKPPLPVTGSSGTKSFESAATRNADGTFGPKHTRLPPLSYRLAHESKSASTDIDVKA